jgi:hypothetical protein
MRTLSLIGIASLLLAFLFGCSSDAVKRGAYEAIYQKGCMDRSGTPDCDPEHKSYDQYKNDRDKP